MIIVYAITGLALGWIVARGIGLANLYSRIKKGF